LPYHSHLTRFVNRLFPLYEQQCIDALLATCYYAAIRHPFNKRGAKRMMVATVGGAGVKRGPRLGLFLANLLGAVIFGSIWFTFNIVLGNMVALRFLGWLNHIPLELSWLASFLPSSGQLLFEETREAEGRAKKEREALQLQGIYLPEREEEKLDGTALGTIAILSTTLDVVGPAIGIMVTVTALGGEMTVAPAVVLAFLASWACQRMAWRCTKNVIRMTWEALREVLAAPFRTKTIKLNNPRRGNSTVFQQALETPKEKPHGS
jgi:hypothetical protein